MEHPVEPRGAVPDGASAPSDSYHPGTRHIGLLLFDGCSLLGAFASFTFAGLAHGFWLALVLRFLSGAALWGETGRHEQCRCHGALKALSAGHGDSPRGSC